MVEIEKKEVQPINFVIQKFERKRDNSVRASDNLKVCAVLTTIGTTAKKKALIGKNS